jgi:hypothetical protein
MSTIILEKSVIQFKQEEIKRGIVYGQGDRFWTITFFYGELFLHGIFG